MKLEVLLFGICLTLSLTGCSALKEGYRGVWGTSTKALENNRSSAIVRTFDSDYFSCYTKTLDILKRGCCHVYFKDIKKHIIAVYVSNQDTTTVGLFFSEIDQNNTKIEFSSLSTYGKEVISTKVSLGLEKLLHPEKFSAAELKEPTVPLQ